jgi:hypothetical protein
MISDNPFIAEFLNWTQSYTGRVVIEFSSLIGLALEIVTLVAMWKIFVKADKPGWAVLIPIYNDLVLLDIQGDPWWWLFGLMIPVVRFIVRLFMNLDLASVFGKSSGFGLGLHFLSGIFIPILGFGSAEYTAPPADKR